MESVSKERLGMTAKLLQSMSRDLLLRVEDLDYLVRSAPHRYKVYTIPKRKPGEVRVIAQPAREVKRLQYWVVDNILTEFPIHRCAVAYRKGKSILDNAKAHARGRFLLKLDFEDFFHSITAGDFRRFVKARNSPSLDEFDLECLTRILFWNAYRAGNLVLSIGAPSSPTVSNIMLYRFDKMVADFCRQTHVVYTRYADDLSFSTDARTSLPEVKKEVERICAQLPYPCLRIKSEKTVYASKAGLRRVTGLVLANEGRVSLGHGRKRQLRAAVHHFKLGKLDPEDTTRLGGMLAFALSIEPKFVRGLAHRYGKETLNKLLRREQSS